MLNFENLKSGFRDYLENYSKEHPWKKFNLDGENKSIFMYSKEFKDYLVNELNCDASIYSQSMSEIMSMQIVDGKLVAGNSQGSKEQQGATLKVLEEASRKQEDELSQGQEELSQAADEDEIVTEVMNDLMQDKTFKKALDTDKDGEISDEELVAFYETIKNNDKDDKNVSLDDIINAAQDIKNGDFKITYKPEEEAAQDAASAADKASSGGGASGAGGAGGASGAGSAGSSGGAGSMPSASQGTSGANTQKSLQNMTVPELQQELMSASSDLGEKQNALSEIQTESDSRLEQANEI
ncbi:MAG: hypothetical protein IJ877_00490, partial [Candidatus Gastranaerophilales bacterium]|nr:hypothetical protein [Candidatus Gastranaerophilales bacterium]